MIYVLSRADPKCDETEMVASRNRNSSKINTPGNILFVYYDCISDWYLSGASPPPEMSRINSIQHCKCRKCKPMPSEDESVCCREVKINKECMRGKTLNALFNI